MSQPAPYRVGGQLAVLLMAQPEGIEDAASRAVYADADLFVQQQRATVDLERGGAEDVPGDRILNRRKVYSGGGGLCTNPSGGA